MSDSDSQRRPWRDAALTPFVKVGGTLLLAVAIGVGTLVATGRLRRPSTKPEPVKLADAIARTIETRGIEVAVAQYRTLRAQGFPGFRERESDTNTLGYTLLGKEDTAAAIRVFQLNVETHPTSANVYDSLGEAYLAAGDKSLAIENYRKVVALDPKMKTAVFELQRLTNAKRKPYPPLVLLHICAGALGIVSGAVALCLRKGSRPHAVVGTVFVVSMLGMSGIAAYLASVAPDGETLNILMGLFTFYLVATAWWTVRRKAGAAGPLDGIGMLAALAIATGLVRLGLAGGRFSGVSLFFGGVALLAALLDLRMILRGGVSGAGRIGRHVWRMCSGLYIAVTSFFLGQSQVFPYAVRKTGLLVVPGVLVVLALIYWMIRVLFNKAYKKPAPLERKLVLDQAAT